MGQKTRSESIEGFRYRIVTATDYCYNTRGNIASSLTTVPEDFFKKTIFSRIYLANDSIVTNYQYDEKDQLIRQYANDSTGRMYFEGIYSYNPLIIYYRWFDRAGIILRETKETFEYNKFMKQIVSTRYMDGIADSTSMVEFKNTYDEQGKLLAINYHADVCSSNCKFRYYKNGLLKAKRGDKCYPNWKFRYKYYH